jgi:hypothetical protein
VFGGPGFLAANAISLAARLFIAGIGSSGMGQVSFGGGVTGFGQGGFAGGFALQAAPVSQACGFGPGYWGAGPAYWGACGPYAYQPFGWPAAGYISGPVIGFNAHW